MKLALSLILFLLNGLADARTPVELNSSGGWSGNGGGMHHVNDNVWYLGPEPIRYCLRSKEDYPLSPAELKAMVRRTFSGWQQFFGKYHIGEAPARPEAVPSIQPRMTLTAREVSCDDRPELELYFGLDNELLRLYREVHENDGYGLALRSAYNHLQHRHQGYVWIPAFDQDPRKIEHMLLHELGHVFGMKHDTVFVMDRDIALMLKSMPSDDPASAFLTRIESDFWPYDLTAGSRVRLVPYARKLAASKPTPMHACTQGSLSLADIPMEFNPLPMPLQPCVRVTLHKNHDRLENNFQLTLESEAGTWLHTIWGTFQALQSGNEESMVPGTLSTWLDARSSPRPWLYVPYAQRMMHAQLSGYFILGQTRYPAKISWSRGLTLEIFIPAQARWWLIRSFSA